MKARWQLVGSLLTFLLVFLVILAILYRYGTSTYFEIPDVMRVPIVVSPDEVTVSSYDKSFKTPYLYLENTTYVLSYTTTLNPEAILQWYDNQFSKTTWKRICTIRNSSTDPIDKEFPISNEGCSIVFGYHEPKEVEAFRLYSSSLEINAPPSQDHITLYLDPNGSTTNVGIHIFHVTRAIEP